MRAVSPASLIVLSLLLGLAAVLSAGGSGRGEVAAKRPLGQALCELRGWRKTAEHAMDRTMVEALDLDGYLFRTYECNGGRVGLYVGYYRSAKKVGAAHDPLVCFAGQGWKIDGRDSGSYRVAGRPGLRIRYSTMTAERQGERELIVYWFQVNDRATATTPAQKVAMALEKISGGREENAFVRLNAPVGSDGADAARRRIFDFIDAFYPQFHNYLTGG